MIKSVFLRMLRILIPETRVSVSLSLVVTFLAAPKKNFKI